MSISTLIVDDEYSGRTALKILIAKNFPSLFSKIYIASTLEEAIIKVSEENIALVFLDINLSGKSGFDLIAHLKPLTKVIFVTAYSEFAIQAIKNNAFDYILKPLNPTELKTAISKFQKSLHLENNDDKYLTIRSKGISIPLHISTIEYLKGNGPYSHIVLGDKVEYIVSKTLKTLSLQLGPTFIRIHKTHLVNSKFIKGYNKDSLITTNNICLPISRIGLKELELHFY